MNAGTMLPDWNMDMEQRGGCKEWSRVHSPMHKPILIWTFLLKIRKIISNSSPSNVSPLNVYIPQWFSLSYYIDCQLKIEPCVG